MFSLQVCSFYIIALLPACAMKQTMHGSINGSKRNGYSLSYTFDQDVSQCGKLKICSLHVTVIVCCVFLCKMVSV